MQATAACPSPVLSLCCGVGRTQKQRKGQIVDHVVENTVTLISCTHTKQNPTCFRRDMALQNLAYF